ADFLSRLDLLMLIQFLRGPRPCQVVFYSLKSLHNQRIHFLNKFRSLVLCHLRNIRSFLTSLNSLYINKEEYRTPGKCFVSFYTFSSCLTGSVPRVVTRDLRVARTIG